MTLGSAMRDSLAANALTLHGIASDESQPIETVIGFCRAMLEALGEPIDENPLPGVSNLADLALDSYEGKPLVDMSRGTEMVRFGLAGLDGHVVIEPGSLGVIAGKTSAGKTSLCVQSVIKTTQAGRPCLVFSLEMTREEIAARWLSVRRGVDSRDIKTGSAPDEHAVTKRSQDFVDVLNEAAQTYIVNDDVCLSYDSICKVIRREVELKGIQVVYIDYFTLVNPPDTRNKNANTAFILGQMSKGFKSLAKELKIAIVLMSQFNREVDDGEEPYLKHLRETGQLEQDANWVLLLWTNRKNYEPKENRDVWIKIEKNRGGERYGRCYAEFNPATGRFEQIERKTEPIQDGLTFRL